MLLFAYVEPQFYQYGYGRQGRTCRLFLIIGLAVTSTVDKAKRKKVTAVLQIIETNQTMLIKWM